MNTLMLVILTVIVAVAYFAGGFKLGYHVGLRDSRDDEDVHGEPLAQDQPPRPALQARTRRLRSAQA